MRQLRDCDSDRAIKAYCPWVRSETGTGIGKLEVTAPSSETGTGNANKGKSVRVSSETGLRIGE